MQEVQPEDGADTSLTAAICLHPTHADAHVLKLKCGSDHNQSYEGPEWATAGRLHEVPQEGAVLSPRPLSQHSRP